MAFPDLITRLSNIFSQFFRKLEDKLFPLKAGKPAKSDDIWFRCITNKSHIKRNGTLHHAAFKGRAISQPSHRRWLSEISGRLNSKAGTVEFIKADGNNRVNRQKESAIKEGKSGNEYAFTGVILKNVCEIRKFSFIKADVIYDPTEDPVYDEAHANFVSYDRDPVYFKDLEVLKMLCENFNYFPVLDLEKSPLGNK